MVRAHTATARHILFASLLAACTYDFPGEQDEGRFACEKNSDCLAGFVCEASRCIRSENQLPDVDCPEPSTSITGAPSAPVYVGTTVPLSGAKANEAPNCLITLDWRVCDAPPDSGFAAAPCTDYVAGATYQFVPDRPGTYRVELRATSPGGTTSTSATVGATMETLFVQIGLVDKNGLVDVLKLMMGNLDCPEYPSEESCNAATDCAWHAGTQFCWADCAGLGATTETECEAYGLACEWDGSTTCTSAMDDPEAAAMTCLFRDAAACAEDPNCYTSPSGQCFPSCSEVPMEDCASDDAMSFCAWDDETSECKNVDNAFGLPASALGVSWADGSAVRLMQLSDGNPRFRWDPKNTFGDGVHVGTGVWLDAFGADFLPDRHVAVFPHQYLIFQGGTPPGCGFSTTLLYWQQGDTLGVPARNPANAAQPLILDLFETQPNLLMGDTYRQTFIAYPHLQPLSSAPAASVRVAFGVQRDDTPSTLPECPELPSVGETSTSSAKLLFDLFPLVFGSSGLVDGVLPLDAVSPAELWLKEVQGASVTGGAISTIASIYPCAGDDDCGAGTCSAGRCQSSFPVHGYLPRLHQGASVLTFSHISCAAGYGTACDPLTSDYNLVLARLNQSTANELTLADAIAADPNVDELDATLVGDPLASSTVWYLGRTVQSITVAATNDGGPTTIPADIPIFGLYKRALTFTGTGWQATPAAGSAAAPLLTVQTQTTALAEPVPCPLGGDEGLTMDETLRVTHPFQFVASADGRYLAYAWATQELVCRSLPKTTLGGSGSGSSQEAVVRLDRTIASDVYVVDFLASIPAPQQLYPESCRAVLEAVNLTPAFLPGANEVVFTTAAHAGDASANRFMRMPLASLGTSTCALEELLTTEQLQAGVSESGDRFEAVGATLLTSRTQPITPPGCDGCAAGLSCGGCADPSGGCAGAGAGAQPLLLGLFWAFMRWQIARRRAQHAPPALSPAPGVPCAASSPRHSSPSSAIL